MAWQCVFWQRKIILSIQCILIIYVFIYYIATLCNFKIRLCISTEVNTFEIRNLGIDEIWISENDIRIVATLSYTNVIRKERGNQGSQLFHIDTKKMGTNLISFVIIPKYLFFFA